MTKATFEQMVLSANKNKSITFDLRFMGGYYRNEIKSL